MDRREYTTDRFPNTDEQAAEVRTWSDRYYVLIGRLGELGTEVRVSRVLEQDVDIKPYNFVRDAVHEFIFPSQEVTVSNDNSGEIDSTPGYRLREEAITRNYDTTQVIGRLQVRYDDSDSRISFSVIDLLGNSDLPADVLAAIDQAELRSSDSNLQAEK